MTCNVFGGMSSLNQSATIVNNGRNPKYVDIERKGCIITEACLRHFLYLNEAFFGLQQETIFFRLFTTVDASVPFSFTDELIAYCSEVN